MNCKQRNWATTTAVVAFITAGSVLGAGLPAHADVPAVHSVARGEVGSRGAAVSPDVVLRNGATRAGDVPTADADTRSWATIIRTAINALKKVPALWNKVVDGVKKSYATFKATVWPVIKAVVNVVSTAITAWDIWKYFN